MSFTGVLLGGEPTEMGVVVGGHPTPSTDGKVHTVLWRRPVNSPVSFLERQDLLVVVRLGAYGSEPYMAMMALTTSGLTVMVTQLSIYVVRSTTLAGGLNPWGG